MKVNLKSITPDAEVNIVEIARVSSSRENKSEEPSGLINYLIRNKHWSPFEHSFLTFEIVTSKAIGIQLLRHRSFTFQEFSQRYAEVENFENIELRIQAEKNRQSSTNLVGTIEIKPFSHVTDIQNEYLDDYQDLFTRMAENLNNTKLLYKEAIEKGIAKECARMILPMTTETTIYMTGSIRSWIHFLEIRDDGHAQKEVQLIAKEMKKIFIEQLPNISKALNY